MQPTSQSNIYVEAFRVMVANIGIAIGCAAAATAVGVFADYLEKPSISMVPEVIIWAALAFAAHSSVLLGVSGIRSMANSRDFGGFWMRSLGLTFLFAVPAVIAAFVMAFAFSRSQTLSIGMGSAAGITVGLCIFSLLGTWLPAVVAGGDRSLSAAFARGAYSFRYVASRLLAGPVLFITGVLFLLGLIAIATPQSGAAAASSPVDFGALDLALRFAAQVSNAYAVVITAVILSRAYMMIESYEPDVTSQQGMVMQRP